MDSLSKLTKSQLIRMLRTASDCFDVVFQERRIAYSFIKYLANGCYNLADMKIDRLFLSDDLKDSLRKMLKILEAVTPQGGI